MRNLHDLIEERLGLDIEMRTGVQLEGLLRQLAGDDIAGFVHALHTQPETSPAWQRLIHELKIGETYFFRDRTQFNLLRRHILPALLEQNRDTRHLTVWCAGCATGEEAYSIAITLLETIPDFDRWRITIVGTDVNAHALDIARCGQYREWSFRHDDENRKQQYFTRIDGGYVLSDRIRELVKFRHVNLLTMPQQPWAHLTLCRNVLLYFKPNTKERAEHLLHKTLYPGGWLLLGHAEAIHHGRDKWRASMLGGVLAYQKPTHDADAPVFSPKSQALPPAAKWTQPLRKVTTKRTVEANEQYQRAVKAYQAEQHEQAERLLADLITHIPSDARARVMLAAVFANRGAMTEAHIQLNTALHYDKLNADAHYLRAIIYLENGAEDKATSALRAALYSETGHPLAAFTLGNLHAKQGDIQRARNLWQQALTSAQGQPLNASVSDFNPRTVSDFITLVNNQLQKSG